MRPVIPSRSGLSRLDVLVVLVLLMLVVGFFVLFISSSRRDADRLHCVNNLKRIGQAILVYEDGKKGVEGKGSLPASRIAEGHATWAVQLAPFLESDNSLAAWDLALPYKDQPDKARHTVISLYLCPARKRTVFLTDQQALDSPPQGSVGDYACVSGDGDPQFPWTTDKANGAVIIGKVLEKNGDAIVRWQSRTSAADLVRGRAYTLVVGEKHVPLDRLGDIAVGDGPLFDGGLPASSGRVGGPGYGLAPNALAPFNSNFGSAHSGVSHFLHADGSVKPYTPDMSEEVLGKLIRIK